MTATALERPDYRKAEKAARRLLEDCGIITPPVDPVALAKGLGVDVIFARFSGDSRKISGFFDCEENAIYVNEEEFPLRQTFTVAHELGHKVLHEDWAKSEAYQVLLRDPDGQEQDFREKEANAFAAALLMPRSMMDEYWEDLSATELSRLFAVSVPAIKFRLSNLYGV